jgi:hypothetical protein
MDAPFVIASIWVSLMLLGIVGGIKRGHKPDTMGALAFFLGPLCIFALLVDRRTRCPQCFNFTPKDNDYCPTCGLQLAQQEPMFWRAKRIQAENLARLQQQMPR